MADTDKKEETPLEKRMRETAEANEKLEKESDDHLKKHTEHLEKKTEQAEKQSE